MQGLWDAVAPSLLILPGIPAQPPSTLMKSRQDSLHRSILCVRVTSDVVKASLTMQIDKEVSVRESLMGERDSKQHLETAGRERAAGGSSPV